MAKSTLATILKNRGADVVIVWKSTLSDMQQQKKWKNCWYKKIHIESFLNLGFPDIRMNYLFYRYQWSNFSIPKQPFGKNQVWVLSLHCIYINELIWFSYTFYESLHLRQEIFLKTFMPLIIHNRYDCWNPIV